MGWLIGRVLFIGSMVVGLTLGTTLALSLVFEGALTFNAPSWRILNAIILAAGLLALLQSTVKTCLSLWLDYTNTNLRVTGLLDGAVVRFLVTAYVLLPQTKPVELLGKLSSSLFSHGVTIQTERQWFTTTSSWGQTLFDGGLVLGFIVNAVLIALALYIALARFLNLDIPTHWTLRRFDLAHAEQTRIERDKLRDKVQTIEAESAALRDNLKSKEKEIVTLNMKLAESNDTAKAQKQESIRLGNELERYQLKFKEIADQLPKIEADRNASVQTIYKLNEDLRSAHDRIEDLEQQIAHLRLQRSNSPSDHADVEDDNPLLTLMAMDRVGATEHVLASEAQRPSPRIEEVELPLEGKEQGVAADSAEVDARADDGDDDQPETTVAPTSIALSVVDDDAVIQGELISDTEQKTVDDIEDDHRAVTMPTVSDVTDAGPLDETTDPINSSVSDASDMSARPEDSDHEEVDETEPQDNSSDHEDQPDETAESETISELAEEFADSEDEPEPMGEVRRKAAAAPEDDPFKDIPYYTHPYLPGQKEEIKEFLSGLLEKSKANSVPPAPENAPTPTPAKTEQSNADKSNYDLPQSTFSDVIHLTPFGSAEFASTQHVENFVKYLFSMSARHPKNEDTQKNFVIEGDVTDPSASYWVIEPATHARQFRSQKTVNPEQYQSYLNDGAYVLFIMNVEGTLYSNFVTTEGEQPNLGINLDETDLSLELTEEMGGEAAFCNYIVSIVNMHGNIRPWSDAPRSVRKHIEEKCHRKVSDDLGIESIISVSHNDQRDHNTTYHIHRIRDRAEGELPQVSRAEINARKETYAHIDPVTGEVYETPPSA